MADSSVAITAGSGTSIDTRTEAASGDHRQVVVIGDPSSGVADVSAAGEVSVRGESDVLEAILREMKILNLYMAVLTGTEIRERDLGEVT